MESPFALLFIAIQARLQSIKVVIDEVEQAAFNFIDQDLGQLEDYYPEEGNLPQVGWPCALIDIDDAAMTDIGSNAQKGPVKVKIRFGFPPFSSSDISTPAEYRNKALYYYELELVAHKVLHGWSPETVTIIPGGETPEAPDPVTVDVSNIFGHLLRIRSHTERRTDFIRVREVLYTIDLEDISTVPQKTVAPASPKIFPTFKIPA